MLQYWVYLWAYEHGAYRDSETLMFGATAFDALLSVMQQRQLTFVDDAVVAPVGSHLCETFHNVSLVQVREVY